MPVGATCLMPASIASARSFTDTPASNPNTSGASTSAVITDTRLETTRTRKTIIVAKPKSANIPGCHCTRMRAVPACEALLIKYQVIIKEWQHIIQHSSIHGPNFINMIADIFFREMLDPRILQGLAEHAYLHGKSWCVVPSPVYLDRLQLP